MTLSLVPIRGLAGLGVVVFASAVFFPVWGNIGFSHIGHWHAGPAQDGWQLVVGPAAVLSWAFLLVIMMTGWTAHATEPRQPVLRRLLKLAFAQLMVTLGALPGAFWFARVGDFNFTQYLVTMCVNVLPAFVGSALTVGLIGRLDRGIAQILGLGLGGGMWYWIFSYGR